MNNVETELLSHVRSAVKTLARMKANDIVVLDLREISSFTDYFIVASATSFRQVKSACDELEKEFKEIKIVPLHIEGYSDGNWVILDYCEFVIHIFYEDTREYYAIERLWADAQKITFPDIVKEYE